MKVTERDVVSRKHINDDGELEVIGRGLGAAIDAFVLSIFHSHLATDCGTETACTTLPADDVGLDTRMLLAVTLWGSKNGLAGRRSGGARMRGVVGLGHGDDILGQFRSFGGVDNVGC